MSKLGVRAAMVAQDYGDDVLEKLLELAPLVAGTSNVWQRAVEAVVNGEDGTLIVQIPGLPGEPPRVTWMGSGWRFSAEPVPTDHERLFSS